MADELISQLENAETPREINAAMKNIRRAQRTFRRDDLATDANYLYKAAQTMLSLRNIAAQDLDPQAREYMIKKKLEEFGSYKECAKSPSQPFGCLPSARTQELITEWKGKLNDYKNTLPNANSTTSVAGRTNIGSARAFDWDVNGRLERYNVGVGTRIPQFGTYDRTLPSQTRFGLQNNNTGFGLNNNGLSTNFGNNRFSSFNNQNLINYNQTAYAGGRASLSSIGRIPST